MKSGQRRLVGKIKRKGEKRDGEKLDKVANGAIDEKGKGWMLDVQGGGGWKGKADGKGLYFRKRGIIVKKKRVENYSIRTIIVFKININILWSVTKQWIKYKMNHGAQITEIEQEKFSNFVIVKVVPLNIGI